MGVSSSKQKTTSQQTQASTQQQQQTAAATVAPSTFAQPYITEGADALKSAFAPVLAQSQAIGNDVYGHLGELENNAFGAIAGTTPAASYNNDVLSGKYLDAGNPYLAGILSDTSNDVAGQIGARFSAAGRTGSGANQLALTKGLASAENNLRYTDYGNERQAMAQAAALSPTLDAAKYQGLGAYLQAAQTATAIPQSAATNYAGALSSLLGRYADTSSTQSGSSSGTGASSGTNVTTSTPSLAQQIGMALQLGGQAAQLFSDRRLKVDIKQIGAEPDGLGRYRYRYAWGGPIREGVMADEVAQLRPWALGPTIAGFATVNYGAL